MAEPPELWTALLVNVAIALFGGVLTMLSYTSYQRTNRRSFRNATLGFAFITLGGTVEPFYQILFRQSYSLGQRELLALQTVEGLLIAIGLALLFYSIFSFNSSTSGVDVHWDPSDSSDPNDQSSPIDRS